MLAGILLFSAGLLTGLIIRRQPAPPVVFTEAAAPPREPLTELDLKSVPLEKVLDDLARRNHQSIVVHWDVLETMGVRRTTPIRARMDGVPFRQALAAVLAIAGPNGNLSFDMVDNVFVVSSSEYLTLGGVLRIYDIRDIIQRWTTSELVQISTGHSANADPSHTYAEWVDALTRLIEDTIAADSWKDNGGSIGSLREIAGLLVVTQTLENHRQLVVLLEELRAGKGPHIRDPLPFIPARQR